MPIRALRWVFRMRWPTVGAFAVSQEGGGGEEEEEFAALERVWYILKGPGLETEHGCWHEFLKPFKLHSPRSTCDQLCISSPAVERMLHVCDGQDQNMSLVFG